MAHFIFSIKVDKKKSKQILNAILVILGISFLFFGKVFIAFAIVAIGVNNLLDFKWSKARKEFPNYINIGIVALIVVWLLTKEWMPLGAQNSDASNLIFSGLLIGVILAAMLFF